MSASPDTADELLELLAALREDVISDAQAERLAAILRDDPGARRIYIHEMALVANLMDSLADVHISPFVVPPCRPDGAAVESGVGVAVESGVGAAVELPLQFDAPEPEPLIPPIIIDASPAPLTPFFSLHSSLGGWLISYGAATVLVGAAILGAWVYKVSMGGGAGPLSVPIAVTQPAPSPAGEPEAELVGRITGTADCQWATPESAPIGRDVALGHAYSLSSGLMEITYGTGAKVILQGPCNYEVESSRGGFLSLGRLTARVGERGEGREESPKSEIRNPKSEFSAPSPLSPLPSPLFSVRTPTAIVTDLGTEFGVEVDRSGGTQSHVFQGKIEVRLLGGDNPAGGQIQLGAGESAHVRAHRQGRRRGWARDGCRGQVRPPITPADADEAVQHGCGTQGGR